ncbi:hypothetical protein V494_02827 [Pseudogymnoascus sp. VKM F-4513 (FW-928)]|nr:hypothetical protein V494_02827 [Pseudogymnoascus sp. VKM F-4513 (FW-928)]
MAATTTIKAPAPSPTPFEEIWSSAFTLYKKQTNRDLTCSPLLTDLRTVDDVVSQVEASQKTFGSWKSKHERLWGRIAACMGPLEVLGDFNVVGGAGAVFGAVVYLLKACEEVEASYGLVETLFEEMAEFTVRLREYAKVEVGESMTKNVVATLACMLEIIGRSEELIRTRRFRHFIGVTWVGKDEKTRDALDRFYKLIDSEERLVVAVTYSSVQTTKQNVDTILSAAGENKKSQKEILGKVDLLSTVVTDSKEEENLRNALWTQAIPKTREIFAEFKENILEGTCKWLHEELLFRDWQNGEASVLWVFGGPGAGKSFLATKTILFLQDQHDQNPEHSLRSAISYFYVKEDNQALHDLNAILKAIAYQIAQKDRTYKAYVLSVCVSAEATNTSEKTWKALFLDFYMSARGAESSAFIVLDGLDEAPLDTRRKFLDLLKVLVNKGSGNPTPVPRLQIAVFSRPDLQDDMEFYRQKFVNVSAQKNRKDIDDYIRSRLPLVRVLKYMKPKARTRFAKEIRNTILENADGMFFWAKLALDQICRKERKSEVQEALKNAPRELDRMIRHVFERVAADPDVNITDLNKILSWVTCAKRPLTLGELHIILMLPTGEPNLSLRRRLKGKFASFINMTMFGGEEEEGAYENEETKDVLARQSMEVASLDFSNLSDDSDGVDDDGYDYNGSNGSSDGGKGEEVGNTNVTPRNGKFTIDEKAMMAFKMTEISFSHKRIKDYLVQEGGPNPVFVAPEFPSMSICISINESELELALTCLSVLLDGIIEEEDFGLMQYAIENFMKHIGEINLSKISIRDKLQLLKQITRLFCDETGIRKLLAATLGDHRTTSYHAKTAIYVTWMGKNEHSKILRECLGDIDSVGTNNFTASQLEWARLSAASVKEFYRPFMMLSSKLWLTKNEIHDTQYRRSQIHVWLLHGYFMMDDDGSQKDDIERFFYSSYLGSIPLESMRAYAEWAGFEKTAYWHSCLAWSMWFGAYYDAAVIEFKKALELDSTLWIAQEGLSHSYGSLGDANMALEWIEKATKNVPSNLSYLVQRVYLPSIAEWLDEIGDTERSIKTWKDVWEDNKDDVDHLKNYISGLHKGNRNQDLVALIMEISTLKSENLNENYETLLIELLLEIDGEAFDDIGAAFNAINATGARAAFLDTCGRAITIADTISARNNDPTTRTMVRMKIASFKYAYCDETFEAIKLWQESINIAASNWNTLGYEFTVCTTTLCQIYYDAAIEAKGRGEDSTTWVDSLKGLVQFGDAGIIQGELWSLYSYSTKLASIIYGRWLRDHGDGGEEAVWKRCFQDMVMIDVDQLARKDADDGHILT